MTNNVPTMILRNNGEKIIVIFMQDDSEFMITLNKEPAIKMATLLLQHVQEIQEVQE